MNAEDKTQTDVSELKASHHPELVRPDMRGFLKLLHEKDEIIVVREEVDPRNFELSAIVQHSENGPNKAVLFENVKGFDMPVVANLYGTIHRTALALGIVPTDDQIKKYYDDPRGSPGSLAGMSGRKMNGFSMDPRSRAELILIKELFLDADRRAYNKEMPYVMTADAPCQEVVIRGGYRYPGSVARSLAPEGRRRPLHYAGGSGSERSG